MRNNSAFKVAFCGLMAALGTVLLSITGLIQIMTYAAPVYVAFLLMPVMMEVGTSAAWATWFVTSVLSLLFSPDKEAAAFYIFIGYYPIIKKHFDRIGSKPIRFLVKLLFFAVSIAAMYALLILLLGISYVKDSFGNVGIWMEILMYVILVAIMMCYDILLERMAVLYTKKFRSKVRKLLHTQ